jgi:hypothetical protein
VETAQVVDLPPGYKPEDVAKPDLPPGYSASDVVGGPEAGPVRRLASSYAAQVNPMPLVRAAADVTNRPIENLKEVGSQFATHPIDTVVDAVFPGGRDLWEKAKKDFESGNHSQGAVHAIQALIPFVGGTLGKAGDQLKQGDVAGGAGTTLGLATNLVAPELLRSLPEINIGKAVRPAAEWLNQTAIKPGGKGTPAVKRALSNISLDEGLPANQAGLDARETLSDQVGGELGSLYKSGPQKRSMSPGPVTKALNNLASEVGQASHADAATVQGVRDEFLDNLRTQPGGAVRNLTPAEAFDLKVAHQQKATQMKKGAYEGGADNSAAVSAHQEIASALGDQLVGQFPEATRLNKRYSNLQKVERPLETAANRSTNTRILDSTGIASTVLGFATGHGGAGLAGSAATLVVKLLRDPAIRSQIAIKMARSTKGMTVSAADAAIGGYLNALSRGTQDSKAPGAMQMSPAMAQDTQQEADRASR